MELREIVFRGKKEINGEWVEGSLHIEWGEATVDGRSIDYRILGMHGECYYVDPSTVGQYTGLKDKNGKRIWEGDIVSFSSSDYMSFVHDGAVIFKEGSYSIEYFKKYFKAPCFHRIGQIDMWLDMGASGIIEYEYKVIGNIHDNPELLKGENDAAD